MISADTDATAHAKENASGERCGRTPQAMQMTPQAHKCNWKIAKEKPKGQNLKIKAVRKKKKGKLTKFALGYH